MEKCPICLEELSENHYITPCCKKPFHHECINKLEEMNCPLCRAKLPEVRKLYNLAALIPYVDISSCYNHGENCMYHMLNTTRKVFVKEYLTRKELKKIKKLEHITIEELKNNNLYNLYTVCSILNDISQTHIIESNIDRNLHNLDYDSEIYILSGAEYLINQ